jgi:Zn finger protein HypA/HybF involved in hydrogenase expression
MKVSKEQIEAAILESKTMSQAAAKLNLAFSTFKRYAVSLDLYDPNQSGKGINKPKKKLQDVFEGKVHLVASQLRFRLIREGFKKKECEICGISQWNNKPISLELDHISGDKLDNSLENLRILCPNCHSQTATFRGKNIGKNID